MLTVIVQVVAVLVAPSSRPVGLFISCFWLTLYPNDFCGL